MGWSFFGRRQPRKAVCGDSFRPSLESLEERIVLNGSVYSGPQIATPPPNQSPAQANPQQQLVADVISLGYHAYRTALDAGIFTEVAAIPESGPGAIAAMMITAAQRGGNLAYDLYSLSNDVQQGDMFKVGMDLVSLGTKTATNMISDVESLTEDLENISRDVGKIFSGNSSSDIAPSSSNTGGVSSSDAGLVVDENAPRPPLPTSQNGRNPSTGGTSGGNGTGSNPSSGYHGPVGTYIGTFNGVVQGNSVFTGDGQTLTMTINNNGRATLSMPAVPDVPGSGLSDTLALSATQNPDGSWTYQGSDAQVTQFFFNVNGNQITGLTLNYYNGGYWVNGGCDTMGSSTSTA